MASRIVCTYTLTNTGPLLQAGLSTRMQAAPLDVSLLSLNGLRLVSDTTSTLVRTITLAMDAATPATATVALIQGGGTSVASAAVGTVGSGYVRPPTLLVVPGAGGGPAAGDRNAATLRANLGVATAAVVAGGHSYSAGTQIVATGGELVPGGVQATFSGTIFGSSGAFTGIAVVTAGGPYNSPPTLTAVDPTGIGTGAVFSVALGVSTISLIKPGIGYIGTPTVTVTPWFKMLYPDSAGLTVQASSVVNFMTGILQLATRSPISSTTVAS